MIKIKLTILLIIVLITSCSVQKRSYMKGFYVSHRTKTETKNKSADLATKDNSKIRQQIAYGNENPLEASLKSSYESSFSGLGNATENYDNLNKLSNVTEIKSKVTEITYYESENKKLSKIEISHQNKKQIKISNDDKKAEIKFHPGAMVCFILSILSPVLLIAGLLFSVLLFYISIICMLTALIVGIVAIIQITKHPEKYKGKVLAIAGLILIVSGIAVLAYLLRGLGTGGD